VLTGDAGGTSDTDYNTFSNVFVRTPGGVANFGVYLAVCDSNAFDNLAVSGFSGGGVGMQLDYSSNNSFPSSNSFFQYEVGSFANAGAPGGFATANKFYGLVEANTAPAPTMANTYAVDGVWKTFTPGFSWTGTATFIVNSAKYKMIGKSTYIEVDFSISAAGTLSNLISFTLPSVPNSGGALPGINYNTAALAGCSIKTGNTTANCVQSALANWALNDRTSFSGVYENQ
jgi:hypothetical protein